MGSKGSEKPGGVLERIVAQTREVVARRKAEWPLYEMETQAMDVESVHIDEPHCFSAALARPGIGVIAEFKRRSPSKGVLREDADAGEVISAYERGGAVALSVLTEEANFQGSLSDLRSARLASSLPILRKDFIVDEYQLYEARAADADAVLLIVAALAPGKLRVLYNEARMLGLDVLVEVHDEEELKVALQVGADIVGINNRNLQDFSVDVGTTLRLMGEVPEGVIVVSESGISDAAQLRELEAAGVSAVLVGEVLMRSEDPEATLRLLQEG